MSIPTYQPLPAQFTAGDTVLVKETYSDYPVGTWTAKMWFNDGLGTAPTGVDGTTSGTDFLFTLSSTFTGALPLGEIFVSVVVTSGSEKKTPLPARQVYILPNFATTQTQTFAQLEVARLEAQLVLLGSDQSRSFNGQSSSDRTFKEIQEQIVYWQSRVIREARIVARHRGGPDPSRIATQFIPGGCIAGPFPYGPWYRTQ